MKAVASIREAAPAKVNLVLHVGRRRGDGLHELCSLFASIDLSDDVTVEELPDSPADDEVVVRPPLDGPNLAAAAIGALRGAGVEVPPVRIEITKRIPVAAGLGGGSADAAAALRAANALAGHPLDPEALRALGARLGADVPSQVEPGHAVVTGAGEGVVPVTLPAAALVLLPDDRGLRTADVYAEADRIGATRARLDAAPLGALAAESLPGLAARLENDLEAAALSLRPELRERIAALREAGALGARLSGSGPTVFGLFSDRAAAERAARRWPEAIVAELRP